jgi:hypothetical protein
MTELQLEKMGILPDKTKLNPNRYWCNTVQDYLTITKTTELQDVLNMIFSIGHEEGICTGKKQRSAEFKNLINNS